MGILEKIQEIEREINRTQKNKGKAHIFQIVYVFHYFANFLQPLNIILGY